MKTLLESEDIQAIAERVIELLRPILSGNGKENNHSDDKIFTPETLAQYLQVDISWVYKQVSNKGIPYFKNGKYVRFKKSSIDSWIKSREKKHIPHFN